MKEIPLTQGKVAQVDDKDYEWLNQWKWHYGCDGYAVRGICPNGRDKPITIYMHRLILNTPRGLETDHINHNRLDNLRIATAYQNKANRSILKPNISGKRGVYWREQSHKWYSKIKYYDTQYYLGTFSDIEEAAAAYAAKAKELFGEFAYTGD